MRVNSRGVQVATPAPKKSGSWVQIGQDSARAAARTGHVTPPSCACAPASIHYQAGRHIRTSNVAWRVLQTFNFVTRLRQGVRAGGQPCVETGQIAARLTFT